MLRSVEIEHFARNDLEISFRPTVPTTQISAVEANDDRRGCRIGFGKWDTNGRQPCDLPADAMGSIADGAGADRAANGQQLREQARRSCERRYRCELGGHIGKLRRQAAFELQGRERFRAISSSGTSTTDETPNAQRNIAI